MSNSPIYTIGHGNRKLEEFIQLLLEYGIKYVIDVRSQPYSKFAPHFNKLDLEAFLSAKEITYVFMGDSLGGRPADKSCYNSDGTVSYEAIQTKDFYHQGIKRLKTAYEKGIKVAIMCSETKPTECHRSKLIGKTLLKDKIALHHIDEKGKLKDQATVINELNKGLSPTDLFGNRLNETSRKSYLD